MDKGGEKVERGYPGPTRGINQCQSTDVTVNCCLLFASSINALSSATFLWDMQLSISGKQSCKQLLQQNMQHTTLITTTVSLASSACY